MNAQTAVDRLLEMDEKEFQKWDAAIGKLKEVQKLRQQASDTMDELRYGLELRRELARHGKRLEDVDSLIRFEFLTPGSPYGKHKSKYGKAWGSDIVGAHFTDGAHVMFDTPIKTYRKTSERELPQYRDKPEKPAQGDPEAESKLGKWW